MANWEKFPSTSLCWKLQNISICRNTFIQHFILRVLCHLIVKLFPVTKCILHWMTGSINCCQEAVIVSKCKVSLWFFFHTLDKMGLKHFAHHFKSIYNLQQALSSDCKIFTCNKVFNCCHVAVPLSKCEVSLSSYSPTLTRWARWFHWRPYQTNTRQYSVISVPNEIILG